MMSRTAFAAVSLAAAAALSGCGGAGSGPVPTPEPSPEPSPSGAPAEQIAEFTGLTPPESAGDLDVESTTTGDGRRTMEASFTTDRAGAEAFCAADGIGVYPDPEGPDAEDRETFGADEETVDGSTSCRGALPGAGRVQRDVLVLYPAEDEASVRVLAYEYE
ncbi:hypothetical protein ACFO4E_00005 [Nocardiopsis mangrovi]|uniref:Uncharacterized protein n=1 Tax=Nocardiopsis mangrovi TaxID=1179818 RepID=A0ABV9DQ75_9ACTN